MKNRLTEKIQRGIDNWSKFEGESTISRITFENRLLV